MFEGNFREEGQTGVMKHSFRGRDGIVQVQSDDFSASGLRVRVNIILKETYAPNGVRHKQFPLRVKGWIDVEFFHKFCVGIAEKIAFFLDTAF
jgi:hypothetical protein